ncbi:MAG: MerR family transcriptional regulator [Cytophagales bacterium]|nr:MerR family transcriptional regulator [Bernardetiaceae bacterium]MDW8203467.1 MerR family transcriptional regulator [Cytophagales bacterium]
MKNKSDEIEKRYYSIGEVAQMFGIAPSKIRFWETQFESIRPRKTRNGVRQYTKAEIENIQKIYHLVKIQGYTLQGAKEALQNNKPIAPLVSPTQIAELIRELQEVRNFLAALKERLN